MAACKGVIDRIFMKNITNLRVSPCLSQNKTPAFLLKYQYREMRKAPAGINGEKHDRHKNYINNLCNQKRHYCMHKIRELDELTFHAISDETLHALLEYFEELGDRGYFHQDYDIEYSDGVLTIKLGGNHGTYVINKQTPNRQIWLSSPTSGPKRYDLTEASCWIYRHNGISLHQLLSEEISEVAGQSVSFINLQYGGKTSS